MTDYQHLEVVMQRWRTQRNYQFAVLGNNDRISARICYMHRPILQVDGNVETVATQMCAALGEDA